MCVVTAYKSRSCSHRWMTITKFCGPGMGFSNTPHHEFKPDSTKFFSGAPRFEVASANTCPNCDKKGQYDGNVTRMVLKKGSSNWCRIACGVSSGQMVVPDAGRMYNHPGFGGNQGYVCGHAYVAGLTRYSAGAPYTSRIPMQGLSPHQQNIEANRMAAEVKKLQFYPNQKRDDSKCGVM